MKVLEIIMKIFLCVKSFFFPKKEKSLRGKELILACSCFALSITTVTIMLLSKVSEINYVI